MTRDYVFTRDDGSQVLVTVWGDHRATIAERPEASAVWGPRIEAAPAWDADDRRFLALLQEGFIA